MNKHIFFALIFFYILSVNSFANSSLAEAPASPETSIAEKTTNLDSASAPSTKTWEELFKEKKYKEAIPILEQMAEKDKKMQQAGVLYNLGIAEMQTGNSAKALAYWRKIYSQYPTFPGLKEALIFAEKSGQVPAQEGSKYSIAKILKNISGFSVYLLSLVLFVFVASKFMNYWKQKRLAEEDSFAPEAKFSKLYFAYSFLLFILLALSLAKFYFDQQTMATIIVKEANTYLWPEKDSDIAYSLQAGMEVFILETKADWLKVENHLGFSAWIPKTSVMITDGSSYE